MQNLNLSDPGVPFKHAYELGDGLIIPALHPKDVEMENGSIDAESKTDQVRASVASTVAPAHRPLLDRLSLHELMLMQHAYSGWVAGLYLEVAAAAMGKSARPAPSTAPAQATKTTAAAPAPAAQVKHTGKTSSEVTFQKVRIAPGGHLPAVLGGHPVGRARAAGDPVIEVKPVEGEIAPLSLTRNN